jgi:chromosome segregation ATPase
MDSLKPDAEDVDLFKERAGGSKASKLASKAVIADQGSAGAHPVKASSFSLFSWLLLVLLMFTLGFAGYTYYQQTAKILALQVDLKNDRNFIRQSKLLMARLEGRLTETGSAVQQTGTEFGKKVTFLDSEVRKLWGVSWDRNKKAIAANASDIAAEKKASNQKAAELKAEIESIKKNAADLLIAQKQTGELLDNAQKKIKILTQSLAQVQSNDTVMQHDLSEQGSKLVSLDKGLQSMSVTLDKLVKDTQPLLSGGSGKGLGQQVQDNAQNIGAINAFRVQVNSRLLSLSAQLSTLQDQILNKPQASRQTKSSTKHQNTSGKAKVNGAPGSPVKRVEVP